MSFPTSWINVSTTDLLRFTFKVLLFYIVFINIYLHSCDVIVSWYNNVKSIVMSKGRRLILLYVNSSECTCVKVLHPLWFNVFSTCRDVVKNLLQNVNSRIHSLIYLKKNIHQNESKTLNVCGLKSPWMARTLFIRHFYLVLDEVALLNHWLVF